MIRFYCLFRSRMAKHEVIERLLTRNISDGQWHRDKYDESDFISKRKLALAEISKCRSRYIAWAEKPNGTVVNLSSYPELQVAYDEILNGHFIQFPEIEGDNASKTRCNATSIYHRVLKQKQVLLRRPQTA